MCTSTTETSSKMEVLKFLESDVRNNKIWSAPRFSKALSTWQLLERLRTLQINRNAIKRIAFYAQLSFAQFVPQIRLQQNLHILCTRIRGFFVCTQSVINRQRRPQRINNIHQVTTETSRHRNYRRQTTKASCIDRRARCVKPRGLTRSEAEGGHRGSQPTISLRPSLGPKQRD